MPKAKAPTGEPMKLGNVTSTGAFRLLAAQEAAPCDAGNVLTGVVGELLPQLNAVRVSGSVHVRKHGGRTVPTRS